MPVMFQPTSHSFKKYLLSIYDEPITVICWKIYGYCLHSSYSCSKEKRIPQFEENKNTSSKKYMHPLPSLQAY